MLTGNFIFPANFGHAVPCEKLNVCSKWSVSFWPVVPLHAVRSAWYCRLSVCLTKCIVAKRYMS